jgi:hypothetical protein
VDPAQPFDNNIRRDFTEFMSARNASLGSVPGTSGTVDMRKLAFPRSAKSTTQKNSKQPGDDDDYEQGSSSSSDEDEVEGRRQALPRTRKKNTKQPRKKSSPKQKATQKGTCL